mgnify:CR=1 FL=1
MINSVIAGLFLLHLELSYLLLMRQPLSLCSSLSVIATLAAPKGAYLTNGSSYSFTLSLSTAISCFSWSLIYFLIVSSLRPTVLT